MKITFFSCLFAVLWSDLTLLIIHMLRKKMFLASAVEAVLFLTTYTLCIFRLIIPIDFSFTKGIPFGGLFASFCDIIFLQKNFKLFSYSFSWWNIFLIVWGIGALISLFYFLVRYQRYMKGINLLKLYDPKRVYKLLPKLYTHLGKSISCTVYCSPSIQVPCGIGLFHKYILLPDINYSDKELSYILTHELVHFANGHLYFKFVYQLFTCVFWWNPILFLLQSDFSHLLEIRCDASVTKHLSPEDTIEYMNTIVHIIQNIHIPKHPKKRAESSVFLTECTVNGFEQERFHILRLQYKMRKMLPSVYIIALITIMLFLFSYVIIPIPHYEAPLEEIEQDGAIYVDPAKSWIIQKEKDYYFIFSGKIIPISEYDAESLVKEGFSLRN